MLDNIFGFGKSKKSKHANGSQNDESPNEDNSFVFVGNNDPNRPPYPQTLMLNDELIRMGASSSVNPAPSNSMYPSLDSNQYPNPKSPYSMGGQNLNVKETTCRNCSPIDNVPFSLSTPGGNGGGSVDDDDEREILKILNQVEHSLETCVYEFKLERETLRGSL